MQCASGCTPAADTMNTMKQEGPLQQAVRETNNFFSSANTFRSFVILILSLFVAYLVSHILVRGIIKVAQMVAVRSDAATDERAVRLRRVETYLGVATAIVKVITVAVVGFFAWSLLSPSSSASVAAIGAGTVFVVLAGGTIGPLLRDITAGATMIIERWFNVGDFIRIEPFADMGGVVEKISLRSTRIRNLNGEVIWVHNQNIQGVRVTPRGVRTIAVDVFVNDPVKGRQLIDRVVKGLPHNTLTIVNKLKISDEEQWGERLWVMSVVGQTPPGREWLMEKYFIDNLEELDEQNAKPVLARNPLVRFADAAAERSFRRAVRAK
jgi:moderate conductance mechanosensitive channel